MSTSTCQSGTGEEVLCELPCHSEEAFLFGSIRNLNGAFAALNVPNENGNALWARADDINAAGDIAGHFRPKATEEFIQGLLHKADGRFFRVNIPDAAESRFTDINNRGEISGFAIDVENVFQPLILTLIPPTPNTFSEDTE
jgi:hypothetical protein